MNIPLVKKRNNLLFIKNVSISDFFDTESIQENRLLDEIKENNSLSIIDEENNIKLNNISLKDYVNFDLYKIPGRFSTLEKWPKKTKIHCWYCDNPIFKIPIFIPKSMDLNNDGEFSMKTHGFFCSFSCAYTYSTKRNTNSEQKLSDEKLLIKLFHIMNGKNIKYLTISPNKYLMKRYGGNLSKNEYTKLLDKGEFILYN